MNIIKNGANSWKTVYLTTRPEFLTKLNFRAPLRITLLIKGAEGPGNTNGNLAKSVSKVGCVRAPENDRSSPPEVFLGKGVLKICSKFTGEHPCRTVISIKLQRTPLWNKERQRPPKNTSGGLPLK